MTEVRFPDIRLNETIEPSGTMNMGAGDFLDIYTETKWHSVITVFFIDTAHNIIDYIERIYKILHPGGTWVSNIWDGKAGYVLTVVIVSKFGPNDHREDTPYFEIFLQDLSLK